MNNLYWDEMICCYLVLELNFQFQILRGIYEVSKQWHKILFLFGLVFVFFLFYNIASQLGYFFKILGKY